MKNKCSLKPGEVCLYCGSVGLAKKTAVDEKPKCPGCNCGFYKKQKKRLYFRKWWHVACVDEVQARAAAGKTETVAEKPTGGKVRLTIQEPTTIDEENMIQGAILVMREEKKASVSLFQRKFKIGYTAGERLMLLLESRALISQFDFTGNKQVEIGMLPEPFTCGHCDFEESDGSLFSRCKKCAGKLGRARRTLGIKAK